MQGTNGKFSSCMGGMGCSGLNSEGKDGYSAAQDESKPKIEAPTRKSLTTASCPEGVMVGVGVVVWL
jgi:hypothetical protein